MTIIKDLTSNEISEYLKFFYKDRGPFERYASFDYCFNYFQELKNDKKKITDDIQLSCLHLGFYLASWGMYRGSTFLLQKSVRVFEPVMDYIASEECDVWGIDVNNYDEGNIEKLVKCEEKIREKLGKHDLRKSDGTILKDREATQTLTTKIMLGVFGNVPAFDAYFKIGFGLTGESAFNANSLILCKEFYERHKDRISKEVDQLKNFKYRTREEANRNYTQAKIIDMIFFTKGLSEDTCWGNYIGKKSETHSDAIKSALKAGYEESRAQGIMKEEWFIKRLNKEEKKKEES